MTFFLRDDIVRVNEQELGLAKWKLVTVAAIMVAGLGLAGLGQTTGASTDPRQALYGPLILALVGYVCAYVDIFLARKLLLVHHIARFIRSLPDRDETQSLNIRWEAYMLAQRKQQQFLTIRWMHFLTSIAATLIAFAMSILSYGPERVVVLFVLNAIPLVFFVVLWAYVDAHRKRLIEQDYVAESLPEAGQGPASQNNQLAGPEHENPQSKRG